MTQRRALAALAGVLAAAAGVGVSMVVAALTGGSNAFIALGNKVIELTPGWLKDFAVAQFGLNDKLVLLISIGVVVTLLAALTGVLALVSRPVGLGLAAALNIVVIVAAVFRENGVELSAGTVLPGLASLVVSVGLLAVLVGSLRPRSEERASTGVDRRGFLSLALAAAAIAAVGGGVSRLFGNKGASSRAEIALQAAATKAPPVPAGVDLDVKGITPYMTSNKDFYRIDTAINVPQVDAGSWKLTIHGMVDKEVSFSYAELEKMPQVERRITLTCVSNEVGGDYVGNATWQGVLLRDLLKAAGAKSGADAVQSTSVDGMVIGTPLAALTDDRDAMLALGMNGQPLPLEHGFPARMVVPGLFGYVSATKWVTDLEVTKFGQFETYWGKRGWADKAPIHTESRFDTPTQFAQVPAGTIPVAGVAWAQNTGIDKVEVRVDGGAWQQARLAAEDSIVTWRQWVFPYEAKAGMHKLEVRATDNSGYTQTPRRTPPRPDGATGWHSLTINVT